MAAVIHGLEIHLFVLMLNHFHLIASTPAANISKAMNRFMEMSSRRIGGQSNRINRIWGSRYYKSILSSEAYFKNAYKYNYFNPVKAGVVERCEDYQFSTLNGLLGHSQILMPLKPDLLLMDDPELTLTWLNSRPSDEKLSAIKAALRKSQFRHVKCPNSKKQIILDDEVI